MPTTANQPTWAQQLESVYDSAIQIAGTHDVQTALQMIADSARMIAAAEFAALGVPGEKGEPMAHFVVSGVPPEIAEGAGNPPMGQGVLGVILADGESLRMPNLADHPAYHGYPATHPHIKAFLGVPVRTAGEVVGDLYLGNKIGGEEFSETDQRLIEMLAAHAATVIQSLRYQKKVAELARLREHETLGRELQDNVLQTLYGSGLLLGQIDLDDKVSATARIKDVRSGLDVAIDYLRGHLMRLSKPQDNAGLNE
jgi:GAF domain-containing protein